ncbi:hypothetical protein GCM10011498_02470 [Amylibacter cionae]|uniref:Transposase n=1 Tax=Neptunicoccus cionae TaxID=2035344 RepID=A0A916VMP6_9RHOB|nr:hypothetical protein GCM10011498_02470 [Amylibacter cionae]
MPGVRDQRDRYRYSPVLSDENEEIADWLERLTANKRNWSFGLCFLYLRNVQGYGWNHKRVYRIYCELEVNLRIKPGADRCGDQALSCIAAQYSVGQWSTSAKGMSFSQRWLKANCARTRSPGQFVSLNQSGQIG